MTQVVRDIVREFGGRKFRMVTRIDASPPSFENVSTAHCLAFKGDNIVLALHRTREWTIPGGHLDPGESPEEAMTRETFEEAGATVTDPVLLAHEQIDPQDDLPADPGYTVPSFQLFYVARLVELGPLPTTDETTESRLFSPSEARQTPGWVQENKAMYEAALALALERFG